MEYGLLLAVLKTDEGGSVSLIRGFLWCQSTNEFDCPQLKLSSVIFTVPSSHILKSVSVIHECRSTCKFIHKAVKSNFERETVTSNNTKLEYEHDYNGNLFYYINNYCIHTM